MKLTLEHIKALTWWEPYATMMLLGKVETRTWKTNYRGPVLICAGQRQLTEAQIIGISGEMQTQRLLVALNQSGLRENHGHAIAVGNLVDCRKMTLDDEDDCYVQYRNPWFDPLQDRFKHLYCHVYEDVTPITPIPFKGGQGWRNLENFTVEALSTTGKPENQ